MIGERFLEEIIFSASSNSASEHTKFDLISEKFWFKNSSKYFVMIS